MWWLPTESAMVLAEGVLKGGVLAAHLSSRREVAAGSMRPSSSNPTTPMHLLPEVVSSRSKVLPIASSRSCCTGTLSTLPRAPQATAASSSSRGLALALVDAAAQGRTAKGALRVRSAQRRLLYPLGPLQLDPEAVTAEPR